MNMGGWQKRRKPGIGKKYDENAEKTNKYGVIRERERKGGTRREQ